jgi:hypothetical protein
MADDFKIWVLHQMRNIFFATRIKIIDANYFIALAQKPFAQMRTEEARSSCDKDSLATSAFHPPYYIISEKPRIDWIISYYLDFSWKNIESDKKT